MPRERTTTFVCSLLVPVIWLGIAVTARAQSDELVIVLPSEQQWATHRVASSVYESEVRVARTLAKADSLKIQLSSHDVGTWGKPTLEIGELVKGTPDFADLVKNSHPVTNPWETTFTLRFKPAPTAPDIYFAKLLAPLEKAADNEVSKRLNQQRWQAAVNRAAADLLREWTDEKKLKDWKVLSKPKFIGVSTDPFGTIRNVAIWQALDELLAELPVKLQAEATEIDTLKLWNDMIGVMFGRITNPQDLEVLSPKEFDRVRLALSINLGIAFQPLIAGKPDRWYSAAPQVTLHSNDIPAADWSGTVGGKSRPVEWLQIRNGPGSDLRIVPRGNASEFAWTQVQGSDNKTYVRVVPKTPQQETEFSLRLQTGMAENEATLEMRTVPPTAVTFPY